MKLIMENWNKFLNEDADGSIKMVSGYLSGIEKIIQMGYEKYAAQTPRAIGFRSGEGRPADPPGLWAQKTGSGLIKQIDRISGVMVTGGYGDAPEDPTEFATFEPMIRKLGEDLISIGKSNPSSQELEGQLRQMGDQVSSLRKMTSQIIDREADYNPDGSLK